MKKWTKRSLAGILTGVALFSLAACGGDKKDEALATDEITIGVTGGPHQQIAEEAKKLAKKDNLHITIKTFDDYNTPNTALNDGDLDANNYQTIPFLETQKKDKGYKLSIAFKTVAFPMGIYSEGLKSVKELKKGDKIAVPNDPSNEYRALKLFEDAGVLKLKKGVEEKATKNDLAENPLDLEIVELEASQIPAQLKEVKAAAINTNFAMGAGLTINDDSIYHEPTKNNPYPNVFVVRTSNKEDEIVEKLKKIYQSADMKQFIEKEFSGSVVPAF
ncbi:MetQ/NlpA family ABC transporter substrate-binding protein [Listeria aquatica]|uniref:Lipoprotein n=1 Tax=Listeria aquatica TaxID=1494960 RepID=A0A841ZQU0_9LIST|nr:MetQ/NlpA family ABC transporter substrate-binding protein [Listeria aquatica]MBC1521555.1 MetQ/NlpA family ABC transporter substrate-binding protein [Listeria aquatica]